MKNTLRRFRAAVLASPIAFTAALDLSAGCASAPRPAPSREARAAAPEERPSPPATREVIAQHDAQVAWCSYLRALYLRADTEARAWPRFQECVGVTSTASPRVLRQTAECSLNALNAFEGDPFSTTYAHEVSRCGAEALDAAAVSSIELEPFLADLCHRVTACGQLEYDECIASFDPNALLNLERAVGALNRSGREELRACLGSASCESFATRVSGCLEPILDRMLWLPE